MRLVVRNCRGAEPFFGRTVTKMSNYTCALRVNEECLSEVRGFFSVIPFANVVQNIPGEISSA